MEEAKKKKKKTKERDIKAYYVRSNEKVRRGVITHKKKKPMKNHFT